MSRFDFDNEEGIPWDLWETIVSLAALHDHLLAALLTVDSMLTAGASAGTIRLVIEEALGDREAALDAKQADDETERARLR